MIVLRKRNQRLASSLEDSLLAKKLKDSSRNAIDIEWEAPPDYRLSSSRRTLWPAPDPEELFDLERSPFTLDPLRNDSSLLQRQQQRDFLGLVALLLQRHGCSPGEIRSRLRDKGFLAQAQAQLRALAGAPRALGGGA